MKFYHNGKQIKDMGSFAETVTDYENKPVPMQIQNDSDDTIIDLHLNTELPIDFDLPQQILPNETIDVQLRFNGKLLFDFKGKKALDFTWLRQRTI